MYNGPYDYPISITNQNVNIVLLSLCNFCLSLCCETPAEEDAIYKNIHTHIYKYMCIYK